MVKFLAFFICILSQSALFAMQQLPPRAAQPELEMAAAPAPAHVPPGDAAPPGDLLAQINRELNRLEAHINQTIAELPNANADAAGGQQNQIPPWLQGARQYCEQVRGMLQHMDPDNPHIAISLMSARPALAGINLLIERYQMHPGHLDLQRALREPTLTAALGAIFNQPAQGGMIAGMSQELRQQIQQYVANAQGMQQAFAAQGIAALGNQPGNQANQLRIPPELQQLGIALMRIANPPQPDFPINDRVVANLTLKDFTTAAYRGERAVVEHVATTYPQYLDRGDGQFFPLQMAAAGYLNEGKQEAKQVFEIMLQRGASYNFLVEVPALHNQRVPYIDYLSTLTSKKSVEQTRIRELQEILVTRIAARGQVPPRITPQPPADDENSWFSKKTLMWTLGIGATCVALIYWSRSKAQQAPTQNQPAAPAQAA